MKQESLTLNFLALWMLMVIVYIILSMNFKQILLHISQMISLKYLLLWSLCNLIICCLNPYGVSMTFEF